MYDPAMCEQPGKICLNPYNLRVLSKQNKQTKPQNNLEVSIPKKMFTIESNRTNDQFFQVM